GETMADREDSLFAIRDLHKRYGHIQEVIVQNLCPKPGTPLERQPVPTTDEICATIRMGKDILQPDIAIQIPPNLIDAASLIDCGVDDLGGVSPLTIDYVNPEHPWPAFDELRAIAGTAVLRERLCIYPQYIERGWYDAGLQPLINRLSQIVQDRNGIP
ncbi:MAG: 7,8-didemethyl-8-hydroxy-5-deazariboflavin synthase subunit CofG, partial [Methanoregula sp.]